MRSEGGGDYARVMAEAGGRVRPVGKVGTARALGRVDGMSRRWHEGHGWAEAAG